MMVKGVATYGSGAAAGRLAGTGGRGYSRCDGGDVAKCVTRCHARTGRSAGRHADRERI